MRAMGCAVMLFHIGLCVAPCSADVVGDVHDLALRTARTAGAAPAAAYTLTLVDLAMFDAANAIEGRYQPYRPQAAPPYGANANAAALGAGCAVIAAMHPSQLAATTNACNALATPLPAGTSTTLGRTYGEAVGLALLAARAGDGFGAPNRYRPQAAAGVYVATPLPLGADTATMKPFALTAPSQFRPGAPPLLTSDLWARDFNEVKTLGSRTSTLRTPDQTSVALFWASNGPQQFLDSIAGLPPIAATGASDRARFLSLLMMAISDSSIAVFDAKNAYDFWRPITAIRNGDNDGNSGTERDPGWTPLIETPLHQEYPCAHCSVSASLGVVLAAALGSGELAMPLTIQGAGSAAPRSWKRATDFVPEVGDARVWSGVHYRNSTTAGIALGEALGRWIVTTQLRPLTAPR